MHDGGRGEIRGGDESNRDGTVVENVHDGAFRNARAHDAIQNVADDGDAIRNVEVRDDENRDETFCANSKSRTKQKYCFSTVNFRLFLYSDTYPPIS